VQASTPPTLYGYAVLRAKSLITEYKIDMTIFSRQVRLKQSPLDEDHEKIFRPREAGPTEDRMIGLGWEGNCAVAQFPCRPPRPTTPHNADVVGFPFGESSSRPPRAYTLI